VIRGPYNTQLRPPAPFVLVAVGDPAGPALVRDLPAQIDTAADRTVLPMAVVEALDLEPIDDVLIGGFGGAQQVVPVYLASVAIQSFPPVTLAALAHAGERWLILGRDVLNNHRLVLDGPGLVLELT